MDLRVKCGLLIFMLCPLLLGVLFVVIAVCRRWGDDHRHINLISYNKKITCTYITYLLSTQLKNICPG